MGQQSRVSRRAGAADEALTENAYNPVLVVLVVGGTEQADFAGELLGLRHPRDRAAVVRAARRLGHERRRRPGPQPRRHRLQLAALTWPHGCAVRRTALSTSVLQGPNLHCAAN